MREILASIDSDARYRARKAGQAGSFPSKMSELSLRYSMAGAWRNKRLGKNLSGIT
jgi:hypothetical protein